MEPNNTVLANINNKNKDDIYKKNTVIGLSKMGKEEEKKSLMGQSVG